MHVGGKEASSYFSSLSILFLFFSNWLAVFDKEQVLPGV